MAVLPDEHVSRQGGPQRLDRLTRELFDALSRVRLVARRLSLDTPGVEATVPMLRGTWGAALHDTEPAAYQAVFGKDSPGDPGGHPGGGGYVLRPAPPDPEDHPAVEWVVLGGGVEHDAALCRGWSEACRRGLGPRRRPFTIRKTRLLGPCGEVDESGVWSLDGAGWPLEGDPALTPCRVVFDAPLRLLRRKRLLEEPTLADLTVGICRRVAALGGMEAEAARDLQGRCLVLARDCPSHPWQGERLDLVRYSGNQKAELAMHGVCGGLALPNGPGSLWPLLAAAAWCHLGKGTVFGLGQVRIVRLNGRP